MARPRTPRPRVVRRRRAPEVARQEILAAAEQVFCEFPPDQVGLKDVARAAGVSHALITHYFGTYAGLVEAALEQRIVALRAQVTSRLREAGALARPSELLAILFRTFDDPVHLRLTRWLLASERPAASHAFALRHHGLRLIAKEVAAALTPHPSPALFIKTEVALLIAVGAAYGYSLGKHALVGSIGREVSSELDDEVQHALGEMIKAHLTAGLR